MIELAMSFILNHRGVTSTFIGPRTMAQREQSTAR
jgi:aryl-alcohol dehydrogenase-like predicted oxidoreductase